MNNNKRKDDNPIVQKANKLPTINQMNEKCISFIKSGEKINDIETIVRELVENSIDAGATKIDIKLAKYGSDNIEIEDNGSGIEQDNLEFIGKRHYTSKIDVDAIKHADYHEYLTTFGFRGEALFCLCNIANVVIITRSINSPTGSKITFNNLGNPVKKEHVARQVGTTVIVKNLFHSLPVRRKELESCGKRQYDKIVRLIQENVLVRPHIKFTLSRTHKMQVIKDFTYGGTTLENTIISIFGIKVFETLIPLDKSAAQKILEPASSQEDLSAESDDDQDDNINNDHDDITEVKVEEGKSKIDTEKKMEPISTQFMGKQFYKKQRSCRGARQVEFKVHGYISKLNMGRHSTDGQFLFVNDKPCDVARVGRLINEIYRSYSVSQTPFYCLFVQVQNWAADFNVPRKRAVILSEENKLCDMIKKILDTLYSPSEPSGVECMNPCATATIDLATYYTPVKQPAIKQLPIQTDQSNQPDLSNHSSDMASSLGDMNSSRSSKRDADVLIEPNVSHNIPLKKANLSDNGPLSGIEYKEIQDPFDSNYKKFRSGSRIGNLSSSTKKKPSIRVPLPSIDDLIRSPERYVNRSLDFDKPKDSSSATASDDLTTKTNETRPSIPETMFHEAECENSPPKRDSNIASYFRKGCNQKSFVNEHDSTDMSVGDILTPDDSIMSADARFNPMESPRVLAIEYFKDRFKQTVIVDGEKLSVEVDYMDDLPQTLARERAHRALHSDSKQYSYAIHPDFSRVSEDQLKINLSRQSFENMEILGQFNKGFIITRFNDHLFIVDQHASHERFNFENQLERCPLDRQPMVRPKPLLLTITQENAIINNLSEFERRGFKFVIDEMKMPGYRVMLSSTSICKGVGLDVHLDKNDIEELINVAINTPSLLDCYTLEKVKNLAATRACRKSVMIGDPLSRSTMKDIVEKMAGLNNPWICAHGRPTIRHLMDVQWMYQPVRRPKWIEQMNNIPN